MPIPPYIVKARELETRNSKFETSSSEDDGDYQTIYAKTEGSVAAPTAGLHFTEELFNKLCKKGVQLEYVTLHVSLGTFQPVTTEKVEDFQIHSEYYVLSAETSERLNKAKNEGRRIIAVGTTSVRVLESALRHTGEQSDVAISAAAGDTSIYIYPGYQFRFVDGIITNFHLPKSSLLLLVSAFAGTENILHAYNHAVEERYRFYSYGDGMVII
jgi:S-adenosylmethionine:tRNA ribosyltransferase-isomerase